MNSSRYAFVATVLAVSQLVHAQTGQPSASPVVAVDAPQVAPAVKPSAQPAPVAASVPTRADKPQAPMAAPAEARSSSEAPSAEPRIIRGNGQVIAPPKAMPALSGDPISFRFEEAPVAEVVRTVMGDILKVDYVMHPPLQGTVTLATRTPIPPDQAVFLLESALQANGLALVRDARGTFHAGRADALKNVAGSVRQFSSSNPNIPPGYGAVIIPLQYIGAGEMASILRPMVSPEAIVRVDTVRNLLVMMGTRTQAEGWMDLVNTFDVDLLKGMSVGVFPLKYASVKEVEVALRLVSGGGGGSPATASLSSGAAPGAVTASTSPAAVAAAGSATLGESNPFFGALRIMPIERINSILVVTPRASYLEEARRWIDRLDKPSDGGSEPQLFIYPVQNGNARHLAGVLGGLFGGASGGAVTNVNNGIAPGLGSTTGSSLGQTGVSNMFGGSGTLGSSRTGLASALTSGGAVGGGLNNLNRNATQGVASQAAASATLGTIRVVADDLNNSILVWGTRAEFNKIEATLKRLDLPLTQVLIDASIIEVTLDDSLEYGLKWSFSGDARSGYSGTGNIGGVLANTVSAGFSYALSNTANNLKATLSALATKKLVKMISNPSLMVLDNHTATIAVGDQVPIQTSVTTPTEANSATTSTIQYKDTGVNLSVTPSVNAGNVVAMQIDQAVTDVGATEDVANGQRRFLQRQISSKVAVRSGESIVLGGLIKDKKDSGKSGVPLLKDIPVVGNLFAQNNSKDERTELLVIITPRVVRSDIDIREVSEDLRERLKGLRAIEVELPISRNNADPKVLSPQPIPLQPN